MVEFKLAEKKDALAACEAAGFPGRDGTLVYRAEENGKDCGFCVITRRGDEAGAFLKTNGVDYIYDGLLRSSLNLMFKLGVKTAVLSGEICLPVAQTLGFRQAGGHLEAEVREDMFSCGCCAERGHNQ